MYLGVVSRQMFSAEFDCVIVWDRFEVCVNSHNTLPSVCYENFDGCNGMPIREREGEFPRQEWHQGYQLAC